MCLAGLVPGRRARCGAQTRAARSGSGSQRARDAFGTLVPGVALGSLGLSQGPGG